MRRRHRHFNPRHAGATFAWDTRFDADSVANNGTVGTWTDRGSSTATQSDNTKKPLWKTGQLNGHPAVVFDGSNDFLETSSITSQTAVFGLGVMKRNWATNTASFRAFLQTASYGASAGIALFTTGGGAFNDWIAKSMLAHGNGYGTGRNPRSSTSDVSVYSDGSVHVASTQLNSTTADIWMDGVSIKRNGNTGSVPSTASAVRIGGNASTGDWGDYSIGMAVYFKDSSPGNALQQRLEHAAAYSFKVACA